MHGKRAGGDKAGEAEGGQWRAPRRTGRGAGDGAENTETAKATKGSTNAGMQRGDGKRGMSREGPEGHDVVPLQN
ncbi:hypothetical protein R54767_04219 [Paraburkholderia gardini]|uniref:Stress-induced acidophilic repeat protein n=1 Tax=Paraburkholderia gardini TaxID=2823469 RepID=A0ABN7QSG9_9BURK|nr:hypothetical protein R54767_04219 [Paraburkholderia gardini]